MIGKVEYGCGNASLAAKLINNQRSFEEQKITWMALMCYSRLVRA